MKKKPFIIIKDSEKEIQRIFNDLQRYGRTTFNFPDRKKHVGLARNIGRRSSPLVDKKLLIPPLSSTNRHRVTGLQTPFDVEIKKKKTIGGWKYIFQRKK